MHLFTLFWFCCYSPQFTQVFWNSCEFSSRFGFLLFINTTLFFLYSYCTEKTTQGRSNTFWSGGPKWKHPIPSPIPSPPSPSLLLPSPPFPPFLPYQKIKKLKILVSTWMENTLPGSQNLWYSLDFLIIFRK